MSRIAAILLPLLIPPFVFAVCALIDGLTPAETASAVVEQYSRSRQNLLSMALLGWFPVILLGLTVGFYRKFGGGPKRTGRGMAWGGLACIVLILLWVNFSYWPKFFPSRVAPMWPHGMEFVIGPLFFAPVAMIPGILAGWLLTRQPKPSQPAAEPQA